MHMLVGIIIPKNTKIILEDVARLIDLYHLDEEGMHKAKEEENEYQMQKINCFCIGGFLEELTGQKSNNKEPDPNCEYCNGTGVYFPKPIWDWWSIGGRYDGMIQGNHRQPNDMTSFYLTHEGRQLRYNLATTDYVLDAKISCYAYVTPDGMYYENGSLRYSNEPEMDTEVWRNACHKILSSFPNHLIIGTDWHYIDYNRSDITILNVNIPPPLLEKSHKFFELEM